MYFFYFIYVYTLINLKQQPVKIMGKNFKSYATSQIHFPREREGSLTAKGPNLSFKIWYGLTVHIIRFSNYKQNFQNCLPQQNSSKLRKFRTLRTKIQIYVIDFQISDHRQRTQENWSEPTTFRSIRPPITRITRIPRISQ